MSTNYYNRRSFLNSGKRKILNSGLNLLTFNFHLPIYHTVPHCDDNQRQSLQLSNSRRLENTGLLRIPNVSMPKPVHLIEHTESNSKNHQSFLFQVRIIIDNNSKLSKKINEAIKALKKRQNRPRTPETVKVTFKREEFYSLSFTIISSYCIFHGIRCKLFLHPIF